jgi:hypothetical protein
MSQSQGESRHNETPLVIVLKREDADIAVIDTLCNYQRKLIQQVLGVPQERIAMPRTGPKMLTIDKVRSVRGEQPSFVIFGEASLLLNPEDSNDHDEV